MFSQNAAIEPLKEMIAYEALWEEEKTSFKSLSERFLKYPGSRPSDFADDSKMQRLYQVVRNYLTHQHKGIIPRILVNGTYHFPERLHDAKEPLEVLYYSGRLDLLETRSVAIVGTRNPSPEGLKRAEKLARLLVKDHFTIISGLAKGIDTQAHIAAIDEGGKTIAVIGTPLNITYPKENADLQKKIAREHLLLSQVPFFRYQQQSINGNRFFFPERNKTMSALSEATIIVEAGETSGTLVQARAALQQGRKLFILNNCFENAAITWPDRFQRQGAIRVKDYDDIRNHLKLS